MNKPIKILFVCVKKGVRASVAQAIISQQSNYNIQAVAACFETGGTPSFLKEELSNFITFPEDESCKTIFEWRDPKENFDYVITMCDETGEEHCEVFNKVVHTVSSQIPSHKHWSIPNLGRACELQGEDRTYFVAKVVGKIASEIERLIESENIEIHLASQGL